LQATIALSTSKAEYMATSEACKDAIWLRGLCNELCGDKSCTTIFSDSKSAICLIKDQMFHERTKHNVRYHYI
jgi:hypothetical protein